MTLTEFISLMNGDLRNEWTHLHFYLYHAGAVTGLHAEEYREFLHDAAKGELEHVLQFTHRLFGLNHEMPNSDGYDFPKFTNAANIIAHAIQMETEVADNYATRLSQLESLAGAHPTIAAYLTIFYEKQLEDSYEDCEKMRRIIRGEL